MRVNEIFYSIQGEGFFTGTPAVFVRLAGCNLRCVFCDTNHEPYKDLTEDEIIREIAKYEGVTHIVITGGEPTLQLTASFVKKLHDAGKEIQVETNGTRAFGNEEILRNIHWITCSPKFEFCRNAGLKIERIDELKVVYDGTNDMSLYDSFVNDDCAVFYRYLQPCDKGDADKNREIINATLVYCLTHPSWKLSLQTQKILKVR